MTADGQPLDLDLSTAEGFARTLQVLGTGAPDTISHVSISGPQKQVASVTFVDGEDLHEIRVSDVQGLESTSGARHRARLPFDELDARALHACSEQMMEASGRGGWHLWSATDTDDLTLLWDVSRTWDPDQQTSITDADCQPTEAP